MIRVLGLIVNSKRNIGYLVESMSTFGNCNFLACNLTLITTATGLDETIRSSRNTLTEFHCFPVKLAEASEERKYLLAQDFDFFEGLLVRAEQPDQRDQHDGHRHQADHPDGQEDLTIHRNVPRRPGKHYFCSGFFLVVSPRTTLERKLYRASIDRGTKGFTLEPLIPRPQIATTSYLSQVT